MNLAWLLPLGFAALTAWLAPLLIHLRRRSELQRTDFAALRWLQARARPRSRLRFEEWPLLLVRLLLLAALAALLAQPVLYGSIASAHWQVFAPGVDPAAAGDVADGGFEQRWLAPGFPDLEDPAPDHAVPIASLLRELDASLPPETSLTVFVPAVLDGVDAQVPVLHRPVRWQVVEAASAPTTRTSTTPRSRPILAVRYAEDHRNAVRYLRAAAVAWQATATAKQTAATTDIVTLAQALPPTDRPLVWLASGPPPAPLRGWIESGGTVLLDADMHMEEMTNAAPLWRDADGNALVRGIASGRGRILQFAKPLSPDAMPALLEPDFPEHLWQLFAPPMPAPARVRAVDHAPRSGGAAYPEQPRDLQPWLLLAIAAIFVIERWMASGRRARPTE